MQLPRVDLESETAAEIILSAGSPEGAGFFFLKMSPEVSQLKDEMFRAAEMFFSLPLEAKRRCNNDASCFYRCGETYIPSTGPGYRAMAEDANFARDLRESFNFGFVANKWPYELKEFRMVGERWRDALEQVSSKLRSVIVKALELNPDRFSKFNRSECTLAGMVKYAPVASDEDDGVFGIRPHQDSGLFTLLVTDGQPGLQICPTWKGDGWDRSESMFRNSLDWLPIEPIPGYFIVNFGTVAHYVSEGRLRATLHRVVIKNSREPRYSLPFFHEPPMNFRLLPNGLSYGELQCKHILKDRESRM